MAAKIINRGRGPEVEGSRITVYDILDYQKHGWHCDRIAALFRLSSEDVQAAFDYIDPNQRPLERMALPFVALEFSARREKRFDAAVGNPSDSNV